MSDNTPWSREEFEAKLRERGRGYHIYHPFHVLMYEGKLSRWVSTGLAGSMIKVRSADFSA